MLLPLVNRLIGPRNFSIPSFFYILIPFYFFLVFMWHRVTKTSLSLKYSIQPDNHTFLLISNLLVSDRERERERRDQMSLPILFASSHAFYFCQVWWLIDCVVADNAAGASGVQMVLVTLTLLSWSEFFQYLNWQQTHTHTRTYWHLLEHIFN